MSKTHYCRQCKTNVVAGRGFICGACRLEDAAWNTNAVRGPSYNISENRSLAAKSITGDRAARKTLEAKLGKNGEPLGKDGADKVEKSVRNSAAGSTLFQRLARGR
jgi:hypothetical protein